MIHTLKNTLLSNVYLKVCSLILGYAFWYIFGSAHTITAVISTPLTFYNLSDTITVKNPESITIALAGKRSHIYTLDVKQLAVHIDGSTLHDGDNYVPINPAMLFLPDTIKVLHYYPSSICVHIEHTTTNAAFTT